MTLAPTPTQPPAAVPEALLFTKKPVTIEAAQFDGTLASLECLNMPEVSQELGSKTCQIPTLEGVMTASPGDWIIKGVKGEFYPCKPDIFAATYAPAAPQAEQPGGAVPGGWRWMTHPDWNNGQPIPVQISVEDGVTYYRPFDSDATEFDWAERDERWKDVAPAAPMSAQPSNPYRPRAEHSWLARYWQAGFDGADCPPRTGPLALEAYEEGCRAAATAPTTEQAGGKAIGWQWVKDPKFPGLSHKEACRQWKPHQKHGWQWTSKSEDRWWYLNGSPETGDEDWTYRRNPAGNELPAAPGGEAPAPGALDEAALRVTADQLYQSFEIAGRVPGFNSPADLREFLGSAIVHYMAAQGQEGAAT